MAEIDMTVPTVAPKVGEYGVDRQGAAHGPFVPREGGHGSGWYPLGIDPHIVGLTWTAGGAYYAAEAPNSLDIIAIIPAPDSVEPDATQETGVVVTPISYEIKAPATAEMGASEYRVYLEHDGVFRVCGSIREHGFSASPAAAIAIARAILRMAGESK